MRQYLQKIELSTRGQGLYEFTHQVSSIVGAAGVIAGLVTVYCRHTSCSLLINENADPDVCRDLEAFMKRLVPDGDPHFIHTLEGPDDMAAHVKTALTATSLSIPMTGGRLALGTWQGIYLFEHRKAPHRREVMVHAIGE
jgi:secondary thiamine-phosphate synthase enzyme